MECKTNFKPSIVLKEATKSLEEDETISDPSVNANFDTQKDNLIPTILNDSNQV